MHAAPGRTSIQETAGSYGVLVAGQSAETAGIKGMEVKLNAAESECALLFKYKIEDIKATNDRSVTKTSVLIRINGMMEIVSDML